jgi:hypothetical protein
MNNYAKMWQNRSNSRLEAPIPLGRYETSFAQARLGMRKMIQFDALIENKIA